jgi:protein farnesyltransferase/geranylgeranyltransferase type-1 subunit alpha
MKPYFRYVKSKISLAPNNASAWNYLRGILDHNHKPYSLLIPFVKPYTATIFKPLTTDEIDLDNPAPGQGAQLPCAYAIEFLADAFAKEAVEDETKAKDAVDAYKSLAVEHDKTHKK